jgi:hypothetical protein
MEFGTQEGRNPETEVGRGAALPACPTSVFGFNGSIGLTCLPGSSHRETEFQLSCPAFPSSVLQPAGAFEFLSFGFVHSFFDAKPGRRSSLPAFPSRFLHPRMFVSSWVSAWVHPTPRPAPQRRAWFGRPSFILRSSFVRRSMNWLDGPSCLPAFPIQISNQAGS